MNTNIQTALGAAIHQFGKVSGQDAQPVLQELIAVFDLDQVYLDKVAAMDRVFDSHPAFDALREVVFDVLLINFFTEDVMKLEEDYLDTPEWEAIEEQTLDRGTELLNVLLYLKECQDEDLEPELGDFLREFLLVDEDEFQDEHRIYEDVIANQILMESPVEEINTVAQKISDDSEIKELFYPMMCFFRNPNPDPNEQQEILDKSVQPDFDSAVYQLLVNFNQQ